MKLLLENWRKLLSEISFEDAKKRLETKALTKWIKGMAFDEETKTMTLNPDQVEAAKKALAEVVLQFVPQDITDNQQGTTLEWIISVGINDPKMKPRFYNEAISTVAPGNHSIRSALLDVNIKRGDLERYWQTHDYSEQKDIFSIETWGALSWAADKAKTKYDNAMADKEFQDPEKGAEVFDHPDKNKWFIAALHTKAAACHYGKRTDWCTATDTDMFDQYYEPDDPLFYFEDRQVFDRTSLSKPAIDGDRRQDGRFQFHFGSDSFMDNNDAQVDEETRDYFIDLLSKVGAAKTLPEFVPGPLAAPIEKYPTVQYWVTKSEVEQIIYDENTTPEELMAIAEKYAGEGEQEIIEMIIDSNVATEEILQYLILNDEYGEAAINDELITDEWLNSLAYSEDGTLRYIAAIAYDYANRGNVLTPEAADKLSDDPLLHIRKKMASHPAAPPETLTKVANRLMEGGEDDEYGNDRTFLSNLLRNNNLPTNLFVTLIEWSKTKGSNAEALAIMARADGTVGKTTLDGTLAPMAMESASRNPNAPPEVLVDIYNTFDNTAESGYRLGSYIALARNKKTPEDILLKLSKNKNQTIKYQAQKTLEKLADQAGMDSLRENFKRFLK